MSRKLCFRFDIDTHKCIREGVPNLLKLAKDEDVPFTFYLNAGKSISVMDSLGILMRKEENKDSKPVQMMSALQKLGKKDYIQAAVLNPNICSYKRQIQELLASKCEVGIHGGKNHALWVRDAIQWQSSKLSEEVQWAVHCIRKIDNNFSPKGFASPGWVHPECLDEVLSNLGFEYSADYQNKGGVCIDKSHSIPHIGVNLVGEPEGVAFFENCRVRGMNDDEIIDEVKKTVNNNGISIMYDHPYYSGLKEISCIKRIIQLAKDSNIDIVRIGDIL